MTTWVLGDIHGNIKALNQVLERSGFDNEEDTLIFLGDVCDGHDHTKQCIDKLLEIKNLIMCIGNHDDWCLEWMETGEEFPGWWHQGGLFTAASYDHDWESVPEEHKKLLREAKDYYVDDDNRVFVHGGFNPHKSLEEQDTHTFIWNRSLIDFAKEQPVPGFKEVFVGHTSTQFHENRTTPVQYNNLWMMDTGAGWDGRLTIMNVDSKEFFTSDLAGDLYPEGFGR